jgi:DNA-binding NtrC family response regulator
VGSNREIRVDTRLVAATNRSLSEAVEAGTFREDLYYRLNVMPVNLPPLRERPEDIPVLAEYFLEKFAGLALGRERRKTFTKGALELLSRHAWPGNVRELENTVQRLVILADDRQIEEADIRFAMPTIKDQEQGELMRLVDVERMYIQKALRKMSGQRTLTAKALGIDRKTLRQKMRKYGLDA